MRESTRQTVKAAAAGTLAGALAAVSVAAVEQNFHTYGEIGTSQGWFVTVPYTQHWCGYDLSNPGFFCDTT